MDTEDDGLKKCFSCQERKKPSVMKLIGVWICNKCIAKDDKKKK